MPFRSIVGHHRLLALLSRAAAAETLPPALLLAGPDGAGKRQAAIALAQALNCLSPIREGEGGLPLDACGECASCRRILRGVHPDVITVVPGDTGSIKIEQVRDVIDRASYRPFEGRRRVVIIDEADTLIPAAQNALLKTLEEPPSTSVFVLVSSRPDALLPTVLSRCPRLRFAALSAADVAAVLMRAHGYNDAAAHAAAVDSAGSVGQALTADAADLAEARASARRLLQQVARARDPGRRIDVAKELTGKARTPAAERDQLRAVLRTVASMLRDIGVLATSADARSVANGDLADELAELAATIDPDRTITAFGLVNQALTALERNASPKVVADWLVLQL